MLPICQSVLAALLVFVVLSAHAYNGEYDSNFDNNKEFRRSVWKNVGEIPFLRRSGATTKRNSGPQLDHTAPETNKLGKYAILKTVRAENGQRGILRATHLDLTGICRVQFFYNMYGANMGILEVRVLYGTHDEITFKKSGNQGPGWKEGSFDFKGKAGKDTLVEFVGIRGNGKKSEISLDDVKFFCCEATCSAGGAAPPTPMYVAPTKKPDCVDSDDECPYWAGMDECTKNPTWMPQNCRKSCRTC